MAVNKVVYGDETLVDLTNDSVTPDTLAEGATAHDASGARITGKMKSGGGVSVQSDWNQTDETAADFIKNKPIVVVKLDFETFALDKTPAEIGALVDEGNVVLFSLTGSPFTVNYYDDGSVTAMVVAFAAGGFSDSEILVASTYLSFDYDGNVVDMQVGAFGVPIT